MSRSSETLQPEYPVLTVGEMRRYVNDLPDEARVLVVVRDPQHFHRVLHDMTVRRASKDKSSDGDVLVLDVQGIS